MRFITVSAESLEKLAQQLNEMVIGSGRVVAILKSGKVITALIDLAPTHVITNDDILMEIEDSTPKLRKIVLSA